MPNKKNNHRRGKRGRRRKSSSALSIDENASREQESPALQSIQDIIAEMKRLPTFKYDAETNSPSRKSTRRHSEPAHQIKASTERLMSKAYNNKNNGHHHQISEISQSIAADAAAEEDDVEDDHIYSHLKHPLDISSASSSTAKPPDTSFPKRPRSYSVSGQISSTAGGFASRRTLYPPHLPLPIATHLVQARELFAGTLAVDWQDSSDANVACEELGGANIYIYGSRNRNRALDGDIVAVELVDVDTMLAEKHARKHARHRSCSTISPAPPSLQSIPEHGTSMLSEQRRPAYCGKVVCILERPRRMLLSGYIVTNMERFIPIVTIFWHIQDIVAAQTKQRNISSSSSAARSSFIGGSTKNYMVCAG